MGMFDNDKVFAPDGRLDEKFPPGETDSGTGSKFILWDAEIIDREFKSAKMDQPATMTHLTVSAMDAQGTKLVVGTLAKAIAAKVDEKADGDLPAVCETRKVSTDLNDALVIQFIEPYNDTLEGAGKAKAKA